VVQIPGSGYVFSEERMVCGRSVTGCVCGNCGLRFVMHSWLVLPGITLTESDASPQPLFVTYSPKLLQHFRWEYLTPQNPSHPTSYIQLLVFLWTIAAAFEVTTISVC
jgi:hypothetical protein